MMNNKKEQKEIEFVDNIDCCFPYQDIESCNKLIAEAKRISTNSVFKVIEELARIPASKRENVTEIELKSLLQKTIDGFEHPFLNSIVKTAFLMIEKKEQSVDKAVGIMEEIEKYPGQWSALSLVYFSCDDIDGIADKKFDKVREKWNN